MTILNIKCPNCGKTMLKAARELTNPHEKLRCNECMKYAYVKLWKVVGNKQIETTK